MNRKEGYYMVQLSSEENKIPALYKDEIWYMPIRYNRYSDSDFSYISPDPIPMEQPSEEPFDINEFIEMAKARPEEEKAKSFEGFMKISAEAFLQMWFMLGCKNEMCATIENDGEEFFLSFIKKTEQSKDLPNVEEEDIIHVIAQELINNDGEPIVFESIEQIKHKISLGIDLLRQRTNGVSDEVMKPRDWIRTTNHMVTLNPGAVELLEGYADYVLSQRTYTPIMDDEIQKKAALYYPQPPSCAEQMIASIEIGRKHFVEGYKQSIKDRAGFAEQDMFQAYFGGESADEESFRRAKQWLIEYIKQKIDK